MGWGYYRHFFPPSRPRQAKGGIKAQSKRGAFGQSWWARRWIEVLESFNISARLGRGRSYARSGQVLSINVGKGTVKAKVQGSRRKPYAVTIKVKPLSKGDWKKLTESLGKQAIFAAKLLAGELPENIEEAFEKIGLSLFPEKRGDLRTDCSCPDWSNPCKHIAAVYYLLGEDFDRDPFLIFKLRGMSRDELVPLIGRKTSAKRKTKSKKAACRPEVGTEQESPQRPEPLPVAPKVFWGEGDTPDDLFGEVRVPPVAAALAKQLGNFPFWRGEERFVEAMERIYGSASPVGMEVFLSERYAERRG